MERDGGGGELNSKGWPGDGLQAEGGYESRHAQAGAGTVLEFNQVQSEMNIQRIPLNGVVEWADWLAAWIFPQGLGRGRRRLFLQRASIGPRMASGNAMDTYQGWW